jgi:hypothetical protein
MVGGSSSSSSLSYNQSEQEYMASSKGMMSEE